MVHKFIIALPMLCYAPMHFQEMSQKFQKTSTLHGRSQEVNSVAKKSRGYYCPPVHT